MELTHKQEEYVSRYIRAVSNSIGARLSVEQSERALTRLRGRIGAQLQRLQKAVIEDAEVLDVLRGMGAPEKQAAILVRVWGDAQQAAEVRESVPEKSVTENNGKIVEEKKSSGRTSDQEMIARGESVQQTSAVADRKVQVVWLGVCAALAKKFDWPVWGMRILFLLIGIAVMPIVVVAYIGVYFWLRSTGVLQTASPVHWTRVITRPGLTVFFILIVDVVGRYGIRGVNIAYENWFDRTIPDLGDWAWITATGGRMTLICLLLLVPLSTLSAMPLVNSWDYSLKRLTQALVTLYAIIVSFGVASYITGLILHFVQEFTG